MKKTILLIGVICVISGWAFAQQITNITQKIENSRVVIHYDLSGDKDATYDISVTAYKESGPLFMGSTMTDGGTIIPTVIAGRLENVKPGKDHFIWWEPVLELRDLHGWIVSLEAMLECVDIDGNTYETIQIGDQVWMAENLKVTHYRNGDAIPTGLSGSKWANTKSGAYSVYDNNESNADTYGYLYNWYAVDDARNIAPEGWHVPTDEEWMELEMYLGMSESEANDTGYRGTDQGSQLAGRADLWYGGNLENNANFGTSGFTALPGGYRNYTGSYANMGNYGCFWSSTENATNAWYRELYYYNSEVPRFSLSKHSGFSVRCIRD